MVDYQKIEISNRVKELKEMAMVVPSIKADRDVLVKEAYIDNEAEPIIVKRAKTLEIILDNIPINIGEDELIVGNLIGGKPRAVGLYLELSKAWKEKELDRFSVRKADRFEIDEGAKKIFRSLFPFWEGKTVEDRIMALMPEETKNVILDSNSVIDVNIHMKATGLGHVALGYNNVLKKGFLGILQEVKSVLANIDIADPRNIKKVTFLKAISIVCEGAIRIGQRYSEIAKNQARVANGDRRKELIKIAEVCNHVPANPARSFWEAVQSFFFVQLITQIETDGTAISPGRFDQFVYPYLISDLNNGKISLFQAQELVDLLWIKFNEILKVWDEEGAKCYGGFPQSQNINIGGQTRSGLDATNDVSYMCLTAVEHLKLPQPSLSVRIHNNTPEEFLLRIVEIIKLGVGLPAVFNDEVIIPAMMTKGMSLEDARDYALVGCVEPSINGKDWPRSNGGFFNLAKALELAINDGKCMMSGKKMGPSTGDPRVFNTFEDVIEAFKKQVAYFARHSAIANNTIETAHAQLQPMPFISSFTENCIEKGLDVTEGGAVYNGTAPLGVGVANVADSLAVIKKLVFEKRSITMSDLFDALINDFNGFEQLRNEILKNVPKYGNDNEYVDELAHMICDIFFNEVRKYKNTVGANFHPALIPVSGNVPLGQRTGALPDGHKKGTPLAEGVSPGQGRDTKGPTAVLKSVSRIDHFGAPGGILLNQKFSPTALKGETGIKQFANYLRAFVALKLQHIQFNVISADILKDAQKKPEEHRDLVVRVAGYSAFFNDLNKTIQDDIIVRTEQMCV